MTDPKRWKDDAALPEELRRDLAEELSASGPPVDWNAMAGAVAAKAAGAPVGAGAGSGVWLKVLSIGVVTAAAIGAVTYVALVPDGGDRRASAPRGREAVEVTSEPDAGVVDVDASAPLGSDTGETTTRAGGPTSESDLLVAARRALHGSPARALAITERHRARHPRGRLAAEREVVAVQALLALGRRAEARARAERFLERHASSIHRRTMETLRDRASE